MAKLSPILSASRRAMRMERMARFELAGYTDVEIAMCIGVTRQYVSVLRSTPEYISRRMQLATGVISSVTGNMEDDIQASTDQLKQMVPGALLALRNAMLDQSNPKLRFEAAKEILDREGTLAKVSKSEIKQKTVFDFNSNDTIGQDLLAALQHNAATAQQQLADATLEEDGFVNTAATITATAEKLNEILNLETLDISTATVN